MKVEIDWLWL